MNKGKLMIVKGQAEINAIKSKIIMGVVSKSDLKDISDYVFALESLVQEASMKNFYGSKGWEYRMGWNKGN